ncbi:hypothetical protein RRF57_001439 [Xylaria bambusicola]|uniref:Uncharacterized protein n=1 Tax=Xylaria bambusicola TaxID=326684 RepID=A0AAN7UBW3_9PEZI
MLTSLGVREYCTTPSIQVKLWNLIQNHSLRFINSRYFPRSFSLEYGNFCLPGHIIEVRDDPQEDRMSPSYDLSSLPSLSSRSLSACGLKAIWHLPTADVVRWENRYDQTLLCINLARIMKLSELDDSVSNNDSDDEEDDVTDEFYTPYSPPLEQMAKIFFKGGRNVL